MAAITPVDGAAEFQTRALSFLLADETRHNLMLGVLDRLVASPTSYSDHDPIFRAVERGGVVAGVALMTPPYNILVSRMEPELIEVLVTDLLANEIEVPGVVGAEPEAAGFASAWERLTGKPMEMVMAQGVYRLEHLIAPVGVGGVPRHATSEDRSLLSDWLGEFAAEVHGAMTRDERQRFAEVERMERNLDSRIADSLCSYYIWEDGGVPVSMAGISGLTPNGARVGPVYTPARWRGRGYAGAVTAHASGLILESGRRFCFLYTDLGNATSNALYRRLGYEMHCRSEQWHLQ